MRIRGWLIPVVLGSLTLTACILPPEPPRTPPALTGEEILVSTVPGKDIDRPVLPLSAARPKGFVDAPSGDGLVGYLAQDLTWDTCGEVDCADIVVPLDYADPGRQAITLALARKAATKSPKLGTLFINPGGPGGSGKGLVDSFNRKGLEQYDIVGWDPRGTNDSTPVVCFGSSQTDAFNQLDQSPDDAAELNALIVGSWEFGKSCWENSGELLAHISTIETVRDLDLMRALVGDPKLNYLGYSYGTAIGATYAELFPQNTGRLVLDAAVDITDDEEVIQAMGFDLALGNFAAWCAREDCGLGTTKDGVLSAITDFLDRLDASPLDVSGRRLTQSLAALGVAAYLYGGVPAWTALAQDLRAAIDGRGQRLLRASDFMTDRNQDGSYGSLAYSFTSIVCLDSVDDGVTGAEARWVKDKHKAPIFGAQFGPGVGCAVWPVRSAPQLDIRGRGAAPLLVIGATGDPATPYQQAVTMADRLESGVLVTYEGEGHGTYGGKSRCVDDIVVAYLTKGTVPADGVRCK